MSYGYMVGSNHIGYLVGYLMSQRGADNVAAAVQIGRTLTTANAAAATVKSPVGSRIHADFGAGDIWPPDPGLYNPVQIVKSVDCLAYQCAAHPGWTASPASDILQSIRATAIHQLLCQRGYESAIWGAPRRKKKRLWRLFGAERKVQ
jgi:hypothetical protein